MPDREPWDAPDEVRIVSRADALKLLDQWIEAYDALANAYRRECQQRDRLERLQGAGE